MTAPATECANCHTPVPSNTRYCLVCGNEVSSPDGTPPPRSSLDELRERLTEVLRSRYEIRRTLGVGGMGAVFLAEEVGLEREVAIKVLPPKLAEDPSVVARFEREAKTAARLDHSHIIPIYRVESDGGLHYFVMKYVAGRALDALIAERGRLPVPEVTRILSEASAALDHAHRKGVVHRDIKPANILLDQDDRVLLADFGIAKAVAGTAELTNTGVVIGTPYYMSPEQALGQQVDGRSDQYSLAVVAYRMLTGEPLFDGDSSMAILYKHIHEPPPRVRIKRPDVSDQLDLAIYRALAKTPGGRFDTMAAFARAARGEEAVTLVSGERTESVARPERALTGAATLPLETTPVPSSRRRLPWVLGIGAAALVGGFLWLRPAPRPATAAPSIPAPVRDTTKHAPTGTRPDSAPKQAAAQPSPKGKRPPRTAPSAGAPKAADTASAPPVTPAFTGAPLTVDATPPGTLFVDDVSIGVTPKVGLMLTPGDHRIRVEREGCKSKEEKITVSSAAPIRRQFKLDCGAS